MRRIFTKFLQISFGFLCLLDFGMLSARNTLPDQSDTVLINRISRHVKTEYALTDFHLDFIPNKLPVFLPGDLPAPYYDPQTPDHPVRVKDQWLWPIQGTGRVYRWQPDSRKMVRMDSTVFFGNTFGSIEFVWADTLYSLGGYGFWRTNGQLRYFDSPDRGWNIRPLNKDIPVKAKSGHWWSPATGQLYYVHQPVPNEGLDNDAQSVDPALVMELNVRSGIWTTLGTAEPNALKILRSSHRIAELPFGELYLEMPPSSGKAYVLDYHRNRILEMTQVWVRKLVQMTNRPAEEPKNPAKCFSYFSDNKLHIITTEGRYLSLAIGDDSYVVSNKSIYEPLSGWSEALNTWGLPVAAMLLFTIGLVWNVAIWRREASKAKPSDPVQFEDIEQLVLRSLYNHPDRMLTTDDINAVLGTQRKNPDLQRKYRSERIKAINEKCSRLLSTSESLIRTERSSDDKRVVLYKINMPLFERIEKYLS